MVSFVVKILFINSPKGQCSIYESGLMAYNALCSSSLYTLDYYEINTAHSNIIEDIYDVYVFNYHFNATSCVNIGALKRLNGLKFTLILEVGVNDPFPCLSLDTRKCFDGFIVLDPTLQSNRDDVFTFPRPLENLVPEMTYTAPIIPVIGSFGFVGPGKYHHVVDAVSREFERAIVRFNIPSPTYSPSEDWYIKELVADLVARAVPGVEVSVTYDFMDKQQLVNWCAQNTLNCFLYDRDCPGLAATCDQAIVSGRPLAVSRSAAFRHIHQYLEPYPRISLQRAIDESLPKIERIRKDWSPERFSCRFEEMLERYNTLHRSSSGNSIDLGLKSALSPVPSAPQTLKKRAKKVLKTLPIYTPIKNFYMSLVRRTKKSEKSEKGLISYAQIYEDIWLYRLFKYHTNGFYIDIGAYHPSLLSITKIFYDNGWRGINIEPNPTFFNEFLEQRPGDINLQMAVSNDEGEVPLFVQNDGGRAASLHAEWMEGVGYSDLSLVQVATKTLATVCEQYVPTDITIEFMSVDVGGHEKAVLESADWRKYRPRVIIIGATRPGKLVGHPAQFSENGLWMEWESILLDASYIPVQFDGLNKYYLRAEDIFLKEYFSVPVSSVLDGFKK